VAYKNIVFVKLEKRLLNDHRWFLMTENAQLIYIKLILLAAETYNKIPKNDDVLRVALRSSLQLADFQNCLNEIKQNFPKFKENKHFCYFKDFESKTNFRSKSDYQVHNPALPKCSVEEEEEEDKEEDKEKKKKPLTDTQFFEFLKTTYDYVDLQTEFKKMDGWLATRPGRTKTRRFIINWLNKVDKPVQTKKPVLQKAEEYRSPNQEDQEKVRTMIHETAKKMGAAK